jgi:hypothetical protein
MACVRLKTRRRAAALCHATRRSSRAKDHEYAARHVGALAANIDAYYYEVPIEELAAADPSHVIMLDKYALIPGR